MKVVVIIVTYNGLKWYKNCFDSLRNSSVPLHPIVIDNNSSDNTISFIKKNYPEIYLVENQKNLGFGKANNIGIKYAIDQNADYIYLLNQDAWVKEDTIEKLVNAARKESSFGIISPLHLSKDEQDIDYNQKYHIAPNYCPELIKDCLISESIKDKIYDIDFTNAAHWLISKECFETVGGFSSLFFLYGEDNNYVQRCKNFSFRIGIYPLASAIHDRSLDERKKVSYIKKRKLATANSLQIFSNIQAKFINAFGDVLFYNLSNSMRNLICLKFKDCILYLHVLLIALFSSHSVYRHRNISKQKGAYLN